MMRMHVGDACKLFSKSQVTDVEHVRSTLQFSTSVELYPVTLVSWLVSWSAKVMKNGSLDLSDFLHEVRGPKSKFGSTAGFFAKNLNFALFGFLWSKWPKIRLFANLLENGSKDFLDFLHNDSSGKLMTSSRARFSKKNVGAEIWGILGVKNDPFCYCSSLSLRIFLKISQNIALLKTFRTM